MVTKGLATCAILLAIAQTPSSVNRQRPQNASASHPAQPAPKVPISIPSAAQGAGTPGATGDSSGFPNDTQPQPRIIVTPSFQPAGQWPLRDRITWGANLVLVILGYAGIMLALSALRKIERQTKIVEDAATAAADCAHAALLNAQAIMDSGRPWLLMTIKPSPDIENSFAMIATNHGRSPARIVGTAEHIVFAIDESQLQRTPVYPTDELTPPLVPIILLPGESAEIKPFSRDDLKAICDSEERLRSIENWEEKVYLHGKVVYRDLIAPPDKPTHETAWCCWYIHGRQKSGMVFAGPAEYNAHT